jgi:hypothetical protein
MSHGLSLKETKTMRHRTEGYQEKKGRDVSYGQPSFSFVTLIGNGNQSKVTKEIET